MRSMNIMPFNTDHSVWQLLKIAPEHVVIGLIFIVILAISITPLTIAKIRELHTINVSSVVLINSVRGFFSLGLLFLAALHPNSPVNVSTPGFVQFSSILLAAYLYYILFFASGHLLRYQFGRELCQHQTKVMLDTYRSRGFTILARILLTSIFIIIVVHTLDADNLLRTSGLIAALLIVLGLSQSAWAPDYIGGLVILYSQIFKEGDTIKIVDNNQSFLCEIYRIKAFHTELLSLVDNHRVIVRNSRMREHTIHNLSKFASAKGLRETLSFKIGYDTPEKQVQAMFRAAFVKINRDHSISVERHHAPEIRVQNTGDHAVEWSVYYFTKDAKRILKTRQSMTEIILVTSKAFNVSLATPHTHQVDLRSSGGADLLRRKTTNDDNELSYAQNFSVPMFTG